MAKITTKKIARISPASNIAFVGIDTALKVSGVCILRDDLAELSLIRTQRLRGARRLAYIAQAVADIFASIEGECVGAIEAGSFGSGGRLYQLGQSQGIAQVEMYKARMDILEVAPTRLKKFFANHGAANKKKMIAQADALLGTKKINDNLADAFALATLAEAYYLKAPSTRKQAEVLQEITAEVFS